MKVSEEYLRWCFEHCDKDKSDYLDEGELDYVANIAGSVHSKEEIRKCIMEKMDTDGTPDGKVSFEEFCAFMKDQPDPRQRLFDAFKVFDENGDGYMDRFELAEILCADEDIDRKEVDDTLARFDVDGDGRLNIAEFITLMTEKYKEED